MKTKLLWGYGVGHTKLMSTLLHFLPVKIQSGSSTINTDSLTTVNSIGKI